MALRKLGKRVYTIGLERRVYTIEASDVEKEKWTLCTVVVYIYSSLSHRKQQAPIISTPKKAQL